MHVFFSCSLRAVKKQEEITVMMERMNSNSVNEVVVFPKSSKAMQERNFCSQGNFRQPLCCTQLIAIIGQAL